MNEVYKFYIDKRTEQLPTEQRNGVMHLLQNPKLGKEVIGEVCFKNRMFPCYSNCLGTVAYTYNIEFETEGIPHAPVSFRVGATGRPGFLNSSAFEEILDENFTRVDNPLPGDVITVNPLSAINYYGSIVKVSHAGIHLARFSPEWLKVFEQEHTAGKFQIGDINLNEELERGCSVYYYRRN